MANTLSNMKVTIPIKEMVSKHRKRYTGEGFNLDLTYIQPNLIAMGFPAENFEGLWRNHIDDVVKFLETKHPNHYFIYNLCSERTYDIDKFHQRVASYPFDDHNPPNIELIQPFCNAVQQWLSEDPQNVAAVHCKAGKGRTGVMICCYMLHIGMFKTAAEALNFYGKQRTTDTKGVTIPSQRRYVGYYSRLIQEGLSYHPISLSITEIRLEPIPNLFNASHGSIMFIICEGNEVVYTSASEKIRGKSNNGGSLVLKVEYCAPVKGDIKIEFYSKQKRLRKEKMFHFWFNTFFIRDECCESTTNCNSILSNSMVNDSGTVRYENGSIGDTVGNIVRGPRPLLLTERSLSCDSDCVKHPTSHPTVNHHVPHHHNSTNHHVNQQTQQHNHKPRASSIASLKSEQKEYSLRIDKGDLDALKDKTNSKYPSDFRVVVSMWRGGRERSSDTAVTSNCNQTSLISDTRTGYRTSDRRPVVNSRRNNLSKSTDNHTPTVETTARPSPSSSSATDEEDDIDEDEDDDDSVWDSAAEGAATLLGPAGEFVGDQRRLSSSASCDNTRNLRLVTSASSENQFHQKESDLIRQDGVIVRQSKNRLCNAKSCHGEQDDLVTMQLSPS